MATIDEPEAPSAQNVPDTVSSSQQSLAVPSLGSPSTVCDTEPMVSMETPEAELAALSAQNVTVRVAPQQSLAVDGSGLPFIDSTHSPNNELPVRNRSSAGGLPVTLSSTPVGRSRTALLHGAMTTSPSTSVDMSSHIAIDDSFDAEELDTSFSSVCSVFAPGSRQDIRTKLHGNQLTVNRVLYLGESTQITDLISQINSTCLCKTTGCSGQLVPYELKSAGLGGALEIKYICNGCWDRTLSFCSSSKHVVSRQGQQLTSVRTIASLALQVAHFVFGSSYRQYYKIVKLALGMPAVVPDTFYHVIELVYKPIEDMLKEQASEALEEMKIMDPKQIGSSKRAVTAGDGTWLQRKFSKNHTFTLRNYLTNALLYYVHLCMKGKDRLVPGELYLGTSKAAEGYGAELAFEMAKNDNLHIEVHWQDGDSSTANAFRKFYPDEIASKVFLCGGHVARAFEKNLKELKGKKKFSESYIRLYKTDFPEVEKVECHCKNRHSYKAGCGCLSDSFIKQARINLYCCLVQAENDPEAFATGMKNLGKYHSKDIHRWEGGECIFHEAKKCTCKKCVDEIVCEGKEYHTRNPLTCPMHALAFEIECERRARQAHDLIHPELGRGNTNIVEASHHVLTKFRCKDLNLQRLHYTTSTNIGLLQANMTYMYSKRGPQYHWILDLYKRLGLPVFEHMQEYLQRENESRMQALLKQKTEEAKKKRIAYKAKRASDLDNRKRWVKQQTISHTYGSDDEEEDDKTSSKRVESSDFDQNVFTSTKAKACKCGSLTHFRITHSQCPLRNTSKSNSSLPDSDSDIDEPFSESENEEDMCICGAIDSGRRAHHPNCPMNPRNLIQSKAAMSIGAEELLGDQHLQGGNIGSVPDSGGAKDIEPTIMKMTSGSSTETSQKKSPVVVTESKSPLFCSCRGIEKEPMIACDSPGCPIEWFHFSCVGITEEPKGKWYCDSCASKQSLQDSARKRKTTRTQEARKVAKFEEVICSCGSNIRAHKRGCPLNPSHKGKEELAKPNPVASPDVQIIGRDETPVIVSGPIPTQEWKAGAVATIKSWSKCNVSVELNPKLNIIPCAEIAPHKRDCVSGDGHCFFRSLSKEITGTEKNYKAVRLAIVNFMMHEECASRLVYHLSADYRDTSYNPVEVMTGYVKRSKMNKCAWATEFEIFVAATLFQCRIHVFSYFGSTGRVWQTHNPVFRNKHCLAPSDTKIYIYHTVSADHYDRVVPCLKQS